jgi:hypothetical protein
MRLRVVHDVMRVLTALALLMSLALQWPVQVVLAWLLETPATTLPYCPECGGVLTDHHICKEPTR